MNTNLLTIDNMLFAGAAVAAPPASKPNTFTNATQFSRAADDTPPPSNTPESTTTDNIPTIAQKEPINKSTQDFSHTLHKKKQQQLKRPSKTRTTKNQKNKTQLLQNLPRQILPNPFRLQKRQFH